MVLKSVFNACAISLIWTRAFDLTDLGTLENVCGAIGGKTLCPFGDAAIGPPESMLRQFREEFEYHVREKRCWKSVASTFEEAKAKSGVSA